MTIVLQCQHGVRQSEARGPFGVTGIAPDELLSSWAARNANFLFLETFRDMMDEAADPDYGRIYDLLPWTLAPGLLLSLAENAKPPDPWLLRPNDRTLYCSRCLAEDWSAGSPRYFRRSWTVAWRTCCFVHGPFHDTLRVRRIPPVSASLNSTPWAEAVTLTFSDSTLMTLQNERRGRYLEAALSVREPNQANWFPQHFSPQSLRATYARIIRDLCAPRLRVTSTQRSSHLRNRPGKDLPNDILTDFGMFPNIDRYCLNVIAEAIVSIWSRTPLPSEAGSGQRTAQIVRRSGWGSQGHEL